MTLTPTDHEALLLLHRDVTQLLALVKDISSSVVTVEQRTAQIESRVTVFDHLIATVRQDMTVVRLEAADAKRTAQGVGKSLDEFRDTADRDKARLAGQVSVIHWIGGTILTVVTALIIAYLSGVLHL